jgi:ubiquinone/menaquinone biosynthesis C-methylase UbiE
MSESFSEIAPVYDALRPLSAGDRARLDGMLAQVMLGPDDLVVEIGCGTGRLTLPLGLAVGAGVRVVGVDPEERMLEVARRKDVAGRVMWRRGTAYRLPLEDGSAKLALMVMVVHLLRRRLSAFREARRVLRGGGRLSLWTFTPDHVAGFYLNEYFPSIPVIDAVRFPKVAVLERELERAGFRRVSVEVRTEGSELDLADVVDRVRGRYISTLSLLQPVEYRQGLQRLEEMLAERRGHKLVQRSEWAILTAIA